LAAKQDDGNVIRWKEFGRKLRGLFEERVLTLRRLMSYIYEAPILDVSRSHTTTHHTR